jgi:hypothetical protein
VEGRPRHPRSLGTPVAGERGCPAKPLLQGGTTVGKDQPKEPGKKLPTADEIRKKEMDRQAHVKEKGMRDRDHVNE